MQAINPLFLGVFMSTRPFVVALAAATKAEAGTWRAYSSPWTMLNHLRTAAVASSSLILVYSLAR